MAAILSRPQCVNLLILIHWLLCNILHKEKEAVGVYQTWLDDVHIPVTVTSHEYHGFSDQRRELVCPGLCVNFFWRKCDDSYRFCILHTHILEMNSINASPALIKMLSTLTLSKLLLCDVDQSHRTTLPFRGIKLPQLSKKPYSWWYWFAL